MRKIGLLFLLALPATLLSPSLSPAMAQGSGVGGNAVVFSVPIGTDRGEVGYEGEHEEMLPWGPTAMAVDGNGVFYVVDGANNRIQCYDKKGSFRSSIDLSDEVVGVVDIEVATGHVIALDIAAMQPAVHRLAADGTVMRSYPIPERVGTGEALGEGERLWEDVRGIHVGPQREVYVENGNAALQLTDQKGAALTGLRGATGFRDEWGKKYEICLGGWSADRRKGEIQVLDRSGNMRRIAVGVPHILGGLHYLGSERDGSLFILVEEIFYDGKIDVDQTIRRYNSDGDLLGIARVPLSEFYVPVENGIAVGTDGDIYALVPKQNRVEMARSRLRSRSCTGQLELCIDPEGAASALNEVISSGRGGCSICGSMCTYRTALD